ncbi:MAG: DUF1566 domain-containing protein [Desulfobacteraceae bacterium]|nr:DUF1566 domain-containing protein [Desulfobacteraceae bacterium]
MLWIFSGHRFETVRIRAGLPKFAKLRKSSRSHASRGNADVALCADIPKAKLNWQIFVPTRRYIATSDGQKMKNFSNITNPENNFPFSPFLASLASDGIRLSVHDYDQLMVVLQTNGNWSVERLKHVLTALLAKNEDQQEIISRGFDKFFAQALETDNKQLDFDIRQVINDLKDQSQSCPEPSLPEPSTPAFTQESPESVCSPKTWKRFIPRILTGMVIVAIAIIAVYIKTRPPVPIPHKKEIPALEVNRTVLNFDSQTTDSETQKKIILTSTGTKPLIIKNTSLTKESSKCFKIPALDFPKTLQVNENLIIPVSFTPKNEETVDAELEIIHNGENQRDSVTLRGTGKIKESSVRKRLYPDVPYVVRNATHQPLDRPDTWKTYAVISGIFLLLTIIYGLYLRGLKTGPRDRKPDWNKDAEGYFNPGTIGSNPLPRLDEETLGFLADSMGYFKSRQPGRNLNVQASIKSTVRQGGIPACVFFHRAQVRTLLILEDAYAEAIEWNPIAGELADGMIQRGVPVLYGRFRGSPETFRMPDGSVYHLDDLEDQRRGILLLIFTDGKSFHRGQNTFALESVARWPMIAWMELRGQRFWDESANLPVKNKIPIYPATQSGIVKAIRRFLTEQGSLEKGTGVLIHENILPDSGDTTLDAWAAHLLGNALPWARDCSMIQPITAGLADELRVRFHPHLLAAQIECLYALPNTTRTNSGMRFSDEVLKVLRGGFLTCRADDEQKEVLKFILGRVEKAKPDAPKESLAYLSWEAVRERVRLEMGEGDGRRFGELLQSPLGKAIGDSLTKHGFSDQPEKIPMRKPGSRQVLQRLAKVRGNPLDIAGFVSQGHRACMGLLMLCFLVVFGWTVKCLWDASGPMPNLEIAGLEKTPARLEVWENNRWKVEQNLSEVGAFTEKLLLDDRKYRMILYGSGYRTINEFETKKDEKTVLFLSKQDVERKCVEEYPDIGLTVMCCGSKTGRMETWKERLGNKAPAGRLMSVGLEIVNSDSSELNEFRNTLLETGSIDVLYSIQLITVLERQQVLLKFWTDLAPWMLDSQLIWYTTINIELTKEFDYPAFGRVLKIGEGDDLSWLNKLEKIFEPEPANDVVVSEAEILQALGKDQTVGKGEPIVLVPEIYRIRSKPETLSLDDIKTMFERHNFFSNNINKSGDFKNNFRDNGDGTVTDSVTGLMWEKSGSDNYMNYDNARAYIDDLNRRKFAGHNDWRLPTLEELASLLENKRIDDCYIDPVFDCEVFWCWSADKTASGGAWYVDFSSGYVDWLNFGYGHYARAVRSRTI